MRHTGHTLIDVGEAALHALTRHPPDQALTDDQLTQAADWMAQHYTQGPLKNHINSLLVHNAGYKQVNAAIREPYVQRTLYSWRDMPPDAPADTCSFCGEPAAYRANREYVPLLNGRNVFNFGANGQPGLPICGRCSLAIHALPLGCFKANGHLVAAYSTDTRITYTLARENLKQLQQMLSLPDVEKLPGLGFERTRFVERLVTWLARAERRAGSRQAASVTGVFFSNSGQNPAVFFYTLDSAVLHWIESVLHHPQPAVNAAWRRAVASAWQQSKKADTPTNQRPNQLYEDLLRLPDNTLYFFRSYVLPSRSWAFAVTYLTGVMQMTPDEIAKIRAVGERFAAYARERRGFFYEFSREKNFAEWRRKVLNAADDSMRRYNITLISFDEFTELFMPQSDRYINWRLVRDLMTLLMIEKRLGADEDAAPLFEKDDLITEDETLTEEEN